MNIRKIIQEIIQDFKEVTVFHGTSLKNLSKIKNEGLKSKMGYSYPQWYMVSTDFESALFHSFPSEEGEDVVVIEFNVPIMGNKWDGYPYFWPPYEKGGNSKWFSLKKPIGKELIHKVHVVKHEDYLEQKQKGF